MAQELIPHVTGRRVGLVFTRADGQRWKPGTPGAFEAHTDGHFAAYKVAAAELGTSGDYLATVPDTGQAWLHWTAYDIADGAGTLALSDAKISAGTWGDPAAFSNAAALAAVDSIGLGLATTETTADTVHIEPPGLRVANVGSRLALTINDAEGEPLDLSTTTARVLRVQKPDGTSYDRTALLATDGSDGAIYYTTAAGDLPAPGYYWLQALLTFADGRTLNTNRARVRVWPNNATPPA